MIRTMIRQVQKDMSYSDIMKVNILNMGDIKIKLFNAGIFTYDNIVRTMNAIFSMDMTDRIKMSGFDTIIKLDQNIIKLAQPEEIMHRFFTEDKNFTRLKEEFNLDEIDLIFSDLMMLLYNIDYMTSDNSMIRI